jgi:hypothetical protein
MIAYHFVGKTLRDGRPIPEYGVWLEVRGELQMCSWGLHASKHVADALKYAPGATLCLVELGGLILEGDDKVCAERRRIIARFDATELLRADARASALSVIHLWSAPDIVRRYLETGDKPSRKEARLAAHAAATAANTVYAANAAADAVYAAAAAAYAAAASPTTRDAHRARLQAAVDAKFREMGVEL